MSEKRSKRTLLEEEGWTRRFVACEPRLSEAVSLYRETGFEVHLEPLPKHEECEGCKAEVHGEDECRICYDGFEDQYMIIYTRSEKTEKI
jgi:hypothetical protein